MALTLNGTTGLSGIAGSAGTPALQGNNDANTGYFFATDTLGLSTAGTERLRITSGGQLELQKDQNGVTGRPVNRIVFKDLDTSVAAEQPIGEISWYSTDSGMANVNSYIRGINEATNGSGALAFGVKASGSNEIEALRITSNGSTIIGGTTPATAGQTQLTLRSNSQVGLSLLCGAIQNSTITFGGVADGYSSGASGYDDGEIMYDNSSNHMQFSTAGGERLRIDSSGNVSIGGIAPVPTDAAYNKALLHIHQTQSGTYGSELHLTNNTTGSAATDGMFLSMWNDNDVYFTNQEAGDINFTTNGHNAFKIQSNKNVKITDGNLIIDTAGHGIDFSAQTATSATGAATGSAPAEVLDHYEEGTWTPAASFSTSGSVTSSGVTGKYTKIGNVVYIDMKFFTTAISSPSGTFTITGLPFAPMSDTFTKVGLAIGFMREWATDMPNFRGLIGGSSHISFYKQATNSATSSNVQGSDFAAGDSDNYLYGSACYVTP